MKFNALKKIGIIVPIVILLLVCAFSSVSIVPEGHIGVKYQLGAIVDDGLAPGPHVKIPFLQSISAVDVREQVYEATLSCYTSDTQTVEAMSIKVNYAYDQSQLSSLIRTIGIDNVVSKLIVPQVNSIAKNATGRLKAEALVQNRSGLQEDIETTLRDSLAAYGITVTAVNIENIDFEDSFEEAIRAKVAAEQEALRMQNETVAKEEQARQTVIAAEAEAESLRIQAEAEAYAIELIQKQLQASPEYIRLQMVEKWDGVFPEVMGDSINPFVILDDSEDSTTP